MRIFLRSPRGEILFEDLATHVSFGVESCLAKHYFFVAMSALNVPNSHLLHTLNILYNSFLNIFYVLHYFLDLILDRGEC